jgi:hypothetical protein
VTDKTTTVQAQWALHRQVAGHSGNRVLACSTGELSAPNFEEAIGRFSPGPLVELPQVTVSYLQPATRPGVSYLALATHQHADELYGDDDHGDDDLGDDDLGDDDLGDDDLGDDDHGDDDQRGMVTRYFCVPYLPLAQAAVTYQAMYRALNPIRLPDQDGAPIMVDIPRSSTAAPAVGDLAVQSAALLLTSDPVCVLAAAGHTSVDERLEFIDAVMALLPYGLRFRMTAATWTSPANHGHRFRLFFSDAARAGKQDQILHWGRPEGDSFAPAPGYAIEYGKWLADKISQPTARLARLTTPIGFGREQIRQMLEEIGIASPDENLNYSATGQDLLHPLPIPPMAPNRSPEEQVLRDCAAHVWAADHRLIKSDIGKLMTIAGGRIDDDQRAHYRRIIKETGLLQHGEKPGRNTGKLYEQLLRVAFTVPFKYGDYCQVEDCLRSLPPHPALLQAIDSAGIAVSLVRTIVYWSLRPADPKKLAGWYASGEVHIDALIRLLAAERMRPHHARIILEVIQDLLRKAPDRWPTPALRAALLQNGFLAHALQANQICQTPDQELDTLSMFLKAAYPDGLDQPAISQILARNPKPPTRPLLAAMLLLSTPGQAPLMLRSYVQGSINGMTLDQKTRSRLASVLQSTPGAGP